MADKTVGVSEEEEKMEDEEKALEEVGTRERRLWTTVGVRERGLWRTVDMQGKEGAMEEGGRASERGGYGGR